MMEQSNVALEKSIILFRSKIPESGIYLAFRHLFEQSPPQGLLQLARPQYANHHLRYV